MKKVIAVTMAVMIAGIAAADLSINWTSGTSGAVLDVGGVYPAGPYLTSGTAQLIWSTTPSVTAAGSYDLAGGATLVDEWMLASSTYGAYGQGFSGSGIFTDADVGGNDISAGYFYTRIFQGNAAGGEYFLDLAQYDPTLATYSATDPLTTYKTPVLDAVYNVDANGTMVAIPEPATIGLMGIAGLGMFLARRKARR